MTMHCACWLYHGLLWIQGTAWSRILSLWGRCLSPSNDAVMKVVFPDASLSLGPWIHRLSRSCVLKETHFSVSCLVTVNFYSQVACGTTSVLAGRDVMFRRTAMFVEFCMHSSRYICGCSNLFCLQWTFSIIMNEQGEASGNVSICLHLRHAHLHAV